MATYGTGFTPTLIHYFSDEITAPRWLRTADGVKFIDGVEAKA
ncbi:hypothetical protein [Klebsiella indica]|nr:hypothetical protein [Klebsiella indica]